MEKSVSQIIIRYNIFLYIFMELRKFLKLYGASQSGFLPSLNWLYYSLWLMIIIDDSLIKLIVDIGNID